MLEADRLELICEGLDTIAEIYINDQFVAATKNMHRTYRFDVKRFVQSGENTIRIIFRSPVHYVEEKQKERYLWAANGDYVVQGFPHLRKAHHMFGWDWGPKLPDSGIWRDIYLCAWNGGKLEDVCIAQTHHHDGSVTVAVDIDARSFNGDDNLEVAAKLNGPHGFSQKVSCHQVNVNHELQFHVQQPALWWPNGLGEQPLYDLTVRLLHDGNTVDERSYRIGLRTLKVRNEPDRWGESFEFVVNGQSIFAKGANYIPEDNIRGRQSRERTERLIRDCVAANFNCIRVWGGGFYPDDWFYDLCDEYGLIVWQDHMFACAEYEMTEEFTEEIRHEVADNVRRIRHHASLGLWCGNNEMEVAWVEWNFPKRAKLRTDYLKQFEIVLPEVTKKHDPHTFYWFASPSSGGGFDDPNDENRGDVHYWEVWHGGKPFTEYRKHYFRFCSEFGFQSFPGIKTVRSFAGEGDLNVFSPVMESHQKNPGGNGIILRGIAENFLYPKDFESVLYVSQLLQAEAMRYGVEHWRRHRGRCMGSIYWQLNDCWPVASWSSLDYFGRWKALHYTAKRFYEPVMLSAEEEGTQVRLAVTNDTLETVSGKVVWKLRDHRSVVMREGQIDVSVEAMSVEWCCELDFAVELAGDALGQTYLECVLIVDDCTVSERSVLFIKPKHFALLDPALEADVRDAGDRYEIDVRATAFALFVELDFKEVDAKFSDNYFHLTAGDAKTIVVNKADLSKDPGLEALWSQLKLRSLYDSYTL